MPIVHVNDVAYLHHIPGITLSEAPTLLSVDLKISDACPNSASVFFVYPLYLKLLGCWRYSLTRITYLSKFIGI
ncbi:hypothetical protein B4900_05940 [Yersinia rohdei]|nr:hypothetical protein B4900_05940 [Yersinia rohdei]